MLNSVIMTGRLVKDVEVKKVNDKFLLTFSIAVSDGKGANGEETVSYFDCAYFTKSEGIVKYLTKGTLVGINARAKQTNYIGKDKKKHYQVQFNVFSVELLGSPKAEKENDEYPF